MDNKRQLIETLVSMIDEEELRSIISTVIVEQKKKLEKLQKLSLGLSDKKYQLAFDELDTSGDESISGAVLKILKEATKPLGNADIRLMYKKLYGRDIKSGSIGNALWKGKNDNIYEKVGSSTSRWTKWRYIGKDEQE